MLVAVVLASIGSAQAQQKGSVMFQDSQDASVTGPARTPLQFDDGPCTELAREVDALAGKPQRRMAAQQRFRAQCGRDHQPSTRGAGHGPGGGGLGLQ